MATKRKINRTRQEQRDEKYVRNARRHGCPKKLARIIIKWCRYYKIPIALGFALIQHESGFRNVFGHDPTIFVGAGPVTKEKYLRYKAQRRASGDRLMQGVGYAQITWWETQNLADKYGGCWTADGNIRVAFQTLSSLMRTHGYSLGIQRYNGSGPAAVHYSNGVRAEARQWKEWLSR